MFQIFLASALLKKTILPEELHNAVVCSNCQQTFLEYVELHRKLSNIEETFSQSNLQSSSSGLGLEGDPGPDNSIEIDNHEDYMLGDIILVEPAQLPSEEHDDAEHQFHVEIVSTLEGMNFFVVIFRDRQLIHLLFQSMNLIWTTSMSMEFQKCRKRSLEAIAR